MTRKENLRQHIEENRANLLRGIEMMKSGRMTTGNTERGAIKDTTHETIADYERIVSDLDDVLKMMANDTKGI